MKKRKNLVCGKRKVVQNLSQNQGKIHSFFISFYGNTVVFGTCIRYGHSDTQINVTDL